MQTQNDQLNSPKSDRPQLDLLHVIGIIWSGRLLIVGFLVCFGLGGIVYALNKPNQYTAVAVLAPVSDEDGQAPNFNLGGLAGLAGINLATTGASKKEIALETLKSKKFLLDVASDPSVLVPLIAGESWDRSTDTLKLDPAVFDQQTQSWNPQLLSNGNSQPTGRILYNRLAGVVNVSERPGSSFIEISVKFLSPEIAKNWLEKIIETLNYQIKQKHINEAEQNIEYLQQQIQQTHIVQMQKVLYELIEVEVRKAMLANVRDDYVFEYVDPPMLPEIKTEPKRAFIVLTFLLTGALMSVLIVLGCHELNLNRFLVPSK